MSHSDRITVHVNAMLKELIPGFLERRRQEVADMAAQLSAADWEALRIAGHSLKGTAGGYGFAELSEIGRAIEEAARASDPGQARALLERYGDYLRRVVVVFD